MLNIINISSGALKLSLTNGRASSFSMKTDSMVMKSVLSVYNADKQNAQSEQLNAIASKLKSEYRDFKDAENEEMTLDLGENFRFQLQSIFRILAKAGIDIEKR